jgi:hypothetical protein
MIHEEYFSCELGVILFVAGIVIVSDLFLLWMGMIIYRYGEKIHKEQLRVLLVLLGIIMLVFTSYGISVAFTLPHSRCH